MSFFIAQPAVFTEAFYDSIVEIAENKDNAMAEQFLMLLTQWTRDQAESVILAPELQRSRKMNGDTMPSSPDLSDAQRSQPAVSFQEDGDKPRQINRIAR